MQAVTIHDKRPSGQGFILAVDLIDILSLFEPEVLASSCRISHLECSGQLPAEFREIGDADGTIPGSELLQLAADAAQVISGDFEAYRSGEERWWAVVRAVDSSLYVVITEESWLLERVRSRFLDVRSSPEDSQYI